MITENGKKIIEPGDVIVCQGMKVTVGEKIYYNDYWKESDGSDNHYCEFIDSNGGYHYWKQGEDGGYVIPKEKTRKYCITNGVESLVKELTDKAVIEVLRDGFTVQLQEA